MSADIRQFGNTVDGRAVLAVCLRAGGLRAVVLSWGAVLQDMRLQGADWPLTLGSAELAAYQAEMGYFGAIVGPVANRIGGAKAVIAGRLCPFAANEGTTLLHGGTGGTQQRLWEIVTADKSHLTLRLALADGDGGFPGNRVIEAHYRLKPPATLMLNITATSDAPSLMNLANHSYWNLDGTGTIAGHRLRLAADSWLPTVAGLPTGERRAAAGVFDLRQGRVLDLCEGYDHNFCLATAPRALTEVAELQGRRGVRLRIATTEPGMQVYDGALLTSGAFAGHGGQPYRPFQGLALEAQRWPDAPNHPDFPPITLTPGESYSQQTRFSFAKG
ncbi:MAG: aldose epimerase family protein [Pseudorhodobacter sp.]|nr:aldose epimerase family protein [Pseudorhodobacter sp.]